MKKFSLAKVFLTGAVSMSILIAGCKVMANNAVKASADTQDTTQPQQTSTMSDNIYASDGSYYCTNTLSDGTVQTFYYSPQGQFLKMVTTNAQHQVINDTSDFSKKSEYVDEPQRPETEQEKQDESGKPTSNIDLSSPYDNADYKYIVKHKRNVTNYFLKRMSKKYKKHTKHLRVLTYYVSDRSYMTQYLTIKAFMLKNNKHIHFIPTNNKKRAYMTIKFTNHLGVYVDPMKRIDYVQKDNELGPAKDLNYELKTYANFLFTGAMDVVHHEM